MTRSSTAVVYHGECNDGFGAAWATYHEFGEQAEYYPVKWGDPLPDILPGSAIYFLDYCPERPILERLIREGYDIVVLDHHKTAPERVEGLDIIKVIDMERSGAVIAWEYFHPHAPIPPLLQLVQDRDLWRNSMMDSELIAEALRAYPYDFEVWDEFYEDHTRLLVAGEALVQLKKTTVARLLGSTYFSNIGGHKVPTVNTTEYLSDIGNRLCQEHPSAPFSACWFTRANGTRKFSLRSIGEFDVSAVAEQFGGGGHRNAAGFVVP